MVVVDTFSDVELLCDVLEASALRNVRVYVLLDRLNLQQFLDMCVSLNVSGKHFPVSLRLSLSSYFWKLTTYCCSWTYPFQTQFIRACTDTGF